MKVTFRMAAAALKVQGLSIALMIAIIAASAEPTIWQLIAIAALIIPFLAARAVINCYGEDEYFETERQLKEIHVKAQEYKKQQESRAV